MPRISIPALRSRTVLLSSLLFILSLLLLSHFASARNLEAEIQSDGENPQNSQSGTVDQGADKPHFLAGSYYSMKGGLSATLMLNNKGPLPLEVRPTLYNLAGERLVIAPVTIDGNSFRMIDLHEWAAPGGETFQEGSVQLFHRGRDLVLGAQIYLVDEGRSLSFDEKLSEIGVFGSARLEGVWWMPSHQSDVRLVLSNTSDEPLSVTGRLAGLKPVPSEPQTFSLSPHETRVLDVRRDFPAGEAITQLEVGAVSLEHAGPKSALLARVLVQDAERGYSFSVQFSNPLGGKSQQYHGAGLRLGKVAGEQLAPVVVARNVGDTATTISGRVPYTTPDGEVDVLTLPSLSLKPGEMKLVDLQRVISRSAGGQEIVAAGLEFEYTTAPGSVVISAQSVSSNGNHVFRVPLWDPLAQRSPTGGYPWYIEGDSSTTVYIKNITDHPQRYIAHILYPGGVYTAGVQTVQARQTITFNLRELRDQQVPDEEGRTIPLDVSRGQILWSLDQDEETTSAWENLALIGRSEQVDTAKAMSSNYACLNCCSNTFIYGSERVEPATAPDGDVGSVGQFVARECKATCYETQVCSKVSATWTSSNLSAVTIDNTGLAVARGAGTATIKAAWSSRTSYYVSCDPDPYPYPTLTSSDTTATTTDATAAAEEEPDPDLIYGGCACRYSSPSVVAYSSWTIRPQVEKIQYQSGSSYVDITGTLFVLKGTTLTFKAVPKPSSAAWPTGRPVWSGSSGATGSGPTKAIKFDTISSSTSDYKTVTASSGNNVTVNVIVFDLVSVLSPLADFTDRSYVRFGLEERIALSFTASPEVSAANAGGLQWKIVTGGGTLPAENDGTVTYTAPESPELVTLKLEIQAGPSKGLGPSNKITIVAPSGAYMTKVPLTNLKHFVNSWSVGFLGNIYLLPKDVSFKNLYFYEGATVGVGDGWLDDFTGEPHDKSAQSRPILTGNIQTGCQVYTEDNAFSGTKYPTSTDPFDVGVWYWDIPWYYLTSSDISVKIQTTRQNHTSDTSGASVITKGGLTFRRIPSDPTTTYR